MTEQPTCGVLYRQALEHFTGMDPEKLPLFAAGFVTGQVEKCYLGACAAAMFRPSSQHLDMLVKAIEWLGALYGLTYTRIGAELWVYPRDPDARIPQYPDLTVHSRLHLLNDLWGTGKENTPEWHHLRAALCGVPAGDVDVRFHEREGYNEPCDRGVFAKKASLATAPSGTTACLCGHCGGAYSVAEMHIHEGVALCRACADLLRPSVPDFGDELPRQL